MLSDEEKAALAEIEAGLYASDRRFARGMSSGRMGVRVGGVLLGVAGMGVVVAAVAVDSAALGAVGFVVSLVGCSWAWSGRGPASGAEDEHDGTAPARRRTGLAERAGRRWERRQSGEL